MLERVPVSKVRQVLPDVQDLLDKAAFYAYDQGALGYLNRTLVSGENELWVRWEAGVPAACAVVGVLEYEGCFVMDIIAMASQRQHYDWRDDLKAVRSHARDMGMARIQLTGRPGWTRQLTEFGFKLKRVELHLELDDGQNT